MTSENPKIEPGDTSSVSHPEPAKPPSSGEAITVSDTGGFRANKNKLQVHLVPSEFIIALAGVFHTGAAKYAPHNWQKGLPPDELIDSMFRHLLALRSGELKDGDTLCFHSDLVAWNALALSTFLLRDKDYAPRLLASLGGPNVAASAQMAYEMQRHNEAARINNNWDHLHGRDKVSEASD